MTSSSLTNKSRYYDNTRISTYKECPRRYFIRHQLHWTPDSGIALALTFGSAWHDGLDIVYKHAKKFSQRDLTDLAGLAFDKTWEENGLPLRLGVEQQTDFAPRTPMIAKEMYANYIVVRWNMLQQMELVAIEQPFAVPLPNLEDVWYVGRLDKVVDWDTTRVQQRLIIEHKTTTAYAIQGNFRSDFVDSWGSSSQVKGYQFGGSLFYGKVDSVWVDAALVHRKVHDAFKLIPQSHNYTLLEEWIHNTEGWVRQIIAEEEAFAQTGELAPGMFKKNEESCFGKYGPCQFLDICRSVADPSKLEPPPNFKVEKWEPFDVLGLDKLIKRKEDETN